MRAFLRSEARRRTVNRGVFTEGSCWFTPGNLNVLRSEFSLGCWIQWHTMYLLRGWCWNAGVSLSPNEVGFPLAQQEGWEPLCPIRDTLINGIESNYFYRVEKVSSKKQQILSLFFSLSFGSIADVCLAILLLFFPTTKNWGSYFELSATWRLCTRVSMCAGCAAHLQEGCTLSLVDKEY